MRVTSFLSRSFVFALAGYGMVLLVATPADAESINQALASAYNNNPSLNAQRAATRAADEFIAIAKSGYRPTVTADANIGLSKVDGIGMNVDLTPRGFGVTVNQTLWDSFLTRNSVDSAFAAVSASQEALRNAEQNILFNGASAYLDVLRNRSILAFQRKSLAFLDEQVRSEQARFDVGEATRTDTAQARASQAAARSQVSLSLANLKSSEAVYRQIIGNEPDKLSPVKGVARLIPRSLQAGMAIAMQEHPAIRSTRHIVDQAIFDVKAAESRLLPRLDLQARSSRNYETNRPDSRQSTSSVAATLSVPIYQAGRQSATVRQNKEVLGQRRIQVDESVDSVRAAVVSAYSQHEGASAALQANQIQYDAARLALQGAVEERKVGQRTTLDVLNTQAQVITAEIALANASRDLKVAGYAILSAIGRLEATTLGLDVSNYDPKVHKNAVEDKWYGLRVPGSE